MKYINYHVKVPTKKIIRTALKTFCSRLPMSASCNRKMSFEQLHSQKELYSIQFNDDKRKGMKQLPR